MCFYKYNKSRSVKRFYFKNDVYEFLNTDLEAHLGMCKNHQYLENIKITHNFFDVLPSMLQAKIFWCFINVLYSMAVLSLFQNSLPETLDGQSVKLLVANIVTVVRPRIIT